MEVVGPDGNSQGVDVKDLQEPIKLNLPVVERNPPGTGLFKPII